MTSRVSFSKLTKQAVRQRLWYGALMFLVFFVSFPLVGLISFQSKEKLLEWGYTLKEIQEETCQNFLYFVGGGNFVITVFVIGAALLGAWSGLSWLHSRKKMDVLGSLPVRREKLLLSETLASVLLFFIPYVVNVAITLGVGASREILTGKAVKFALISSLTTLLFYMAVYVVAAVAMLLTGKILTGILGTGVLLCIVPMIWYLLAALPELYKTHVTYYNIPVTKLAYTSPAGGFIVLTTKYTQIFSRLAKMSALVPALLDGFAFLVVFGALALWLVRIRPSEGAEHSMVFSKTEGVFKAIILYPLVIGGGCFFAEIDSSGHTVIWMWFGALFVAVVGSILIEVIYHFDRKRLLSHKLWTIGGVVAALFTLCVFIYDIFGYDTWIPDEDDVKSAVVIDSVYNGEYPDGSANKVKFMAKHLDGFYDEEVFDLAREGIENLSGDFEEDYDSTYVTVLYKMKNGKVKMRSYAVSTDDYQEIFDRQMEDETYRQAQFPVLLANAKKIDSVEIRRYNMYDDLAGLSHNDMEELLTLYQQELQEMNWDEICTADSASIDFYLSEYYSYMGEYPLNANFTRTMEYLRNKGITLQDRKISDLNITSVTIYRENQEIYEYGQLVETEMADNGVTLTDPDDIAKALEGMVETNYYGYNDNERLVDASIYVEVNYINDDGNPNSFSGRYLKGQVPEIANQ